MSRKKKRMILKKMSRKIRWCNSFYLYFAVIVALVDKYEFDRMFQSRKFCKKKIFEF